METKIIRMNGKNETKSNKKKIMKTLQAILYTVIGLIIGIAAGSFAIYMWFSGTFLANQLVLRKILYVLAAIIITISFCFFYEGIRYLTEKKKRR